MAKIGRGRPQVTAATAAQQRLLRAYQEYSEREGKPPTIRELCEQLEISPATAHGMIKRLERNGYISRTAGKRRGIEAVKEADDISPSWVNVPLVGHVAAGQPVLAPENVQGSIQVDGALVRKGTHFALRVRGTSMIDAGINSGDVVIVRQQVLAEHRDIVVALLNNESTLKRLHHRSGQVQLVPENKRLKPIDVAPDDDFRIIGKVVSVQAK